MARETVTVEIYGRSYTLRGVDPDLARRLARLVDERMRALAGDSATADTLKLAILAGLNLADELEGLRAEAGERTEKARVRAAELVDRIETALAASGGEGSR